MLAPYGFYLMWAEQLNSPPSEILLLQRSRVVADIRTYTTLTLNAFGCIALQNFPASSQCSEVSHQASIPSFPK